MIGRIHFHMYWRINIQFFYPIICIPERKVRKILLFNFLSDLNCFLSCIYDLRTSEKNIFSNSWVFFICVTGGGRCCQVKKKVFPASLFWVTFFICENVKKKSFLVGWRVVVVVVVVILILATRGWSAPPPNVLNTGII